VLKFHTSLLKTDDPSSSTTQFLPETISDIAQICLLSQRFTALEVVLQQFINTSTQEILSLRTSNATPQQQAHTLEQENTALKTMFSTMEQRFQILEQNFQTEITTLKNDFISERRYKHLKGRVYDLEQRLNMIDQENDETSLPMRRSVFPDESDVAHQGSTHFSPSVERVPPSSTRSQDLLSTTYPSDRRNTDLPDQAVSSPQGGFRRSLPTQSQPYHLDSPLLGVQLPTNPNVLTVKDSHVYTKMARDFQPKWDGKPLTWNEFWDEWNFYWSLQAEACGGDQKIQKLLFMQCLPKDDAERFRYWIQKENQPFDVLIQKFADRADTFIKGFHRNQKPEVHYQTKISRYHISRRNKHIRFTQESEGQKTKGFLRNQKPYKRT
jgi:hypothetical protein